MDKQYIIKFGRSDGSARKTLFYKSRIRALELANSMAYVMFYEHPFKNGSTRGEMKYEGNGFFVSYKEEVLQ